MKKQILLLIFALYSEVAFCTTVTVGNSGTTFTPATITIIFGDNVQFTLAGSHNAVEVSQATWNANGNTALSGGFSTPFGGGTVLPDKLTVGTHYYVCAPHASLGMKGTIIVQSASTTSSVPALSPLGLLIVCGSMMIMGTFYIRTRRISGSN